MIRSGSNQNGVPIAQSMADPKLIERVCVVYRDIGDYEIACDELAEHIRSNVALPRNLCRSPAEHLQVEFFFQLSHRGTDELGIDSFEIEPILNIKRPNDKDSHACLCKRYDIERLRC